MTNATLLWTIAGLAPSALGLLQEPAPAGDPIATASAIWTHNFSDAGADTLVKLDVTSGRLLGQINLRELGLGAPISRGVVAPIAPSPSSTSKDVALVACFETAGTSSVLAALVSLLSSVSFCLHSWTHSRELCVADTDGRCTPCPLAISCAHHGAGAARHWRGAAAGVPRGGVRRCRRGRERAVSGEPKAPGHGPAWGKGRRAEGSCRSAWWPSWH